MVSGSEPGLEASSGEGEGEGDPPGGEPRALTEADLPEAAVAIAKAFAWHEPWGAWALPDPVTRERVLVGRIEADIRERFLSAGEASTIAAVAVTLWIPPVAEPGAAIFARRRSDEDYALYGERGEALREADRALAAMIPPGEHWYLDTIATHPRWRRRGLGARLLDHDLAIRDSRAQACALDTHTPENVAFYSRRGFDVVAKGTMPAEGPDLYVMVRPARG